MTSIDSPLLNICFAGLSSYDQIRVRITFTYAHGSIADIV